MTVMTKRGQQDNVITYEHICDTIDDLLEINPEFITLGSVAIVLQGVVGLEVYMATSTKEWILLNGSNSKTDDEPKIIEEPIVEQPIDG